MRTRAHPTCASVHVQANQVPSSAAKIHDSGAACPGWPSALNVAALLGAARTLGADRACFSAGVAAALELVAKCDAVLRGVAWGALASMVFMPLARSYAFRTGIDVLTGRLDAASMPTCNAIDRGIGFATDRLLPSIRCPVVSLRCHEVLLVKCNHLRIVEYQFATKHGRASRRAVRGLRHEFMLLRQRRPRRRVAVRHMKQMLRSVSKPYVQSAARYSGHVVLAPVSTLRREPLKYLTFIRRKTHEENCPVSRYLFRVRRGSRRSEETSYGACHPHCRYREEDKRHQCGCRYGRSPGEGQYAGRREHGRRYPSR